MNVHLLVIGNRDGKDNLGAKPRAEVIADILQSIKERRA
jgi:hypothetical protein